MADLINLNRVRKDRARAGAKAAAAENRVLHGRSKAQKAAQADAKDKAARALDGARREP